MSHCPDNTAPLFARLFSSSGTGVPRTEVEDKVRNNRIRFLAKAILVLCEVQLSSQETASYIERWRPVDFKSPAEIGGSISQRKNWKVRWSVIRQEEGKEFMPENTADPFLGALAVINLSNYKNRSFDKTKTTHRLKNNEALEDHRKIQHKVICARCSRPDRKESRPLLRRNQSLDHSLTVETKHPSREGL